MQIESELFTDRRNNTLQGTRKKLPWPKNKPFKILSLDGGGIRGLYGASLLSIIERDVIKGENIADYFDMISGTSTGGIIALGLGLGVPAEKIEYLYRIKGKEIFHQPWYWSMPCIKTLFHINHVLYNHETLEKFLHEVFENKTLGEARARIVVPAFMAPKTEIAVFKTDHHPDYRNDYKSLVWEIARATSAAPTYLKGHTYKDKIFLDGGVWANNPIMVAIIDVLSAYDIKPEQLQILSIGTGNFPFEITLKNAGRGLWRWKEVIKAAMYLTTDNAHAQAALLLGPNCILRLEPSEEADRIDLDDWKGALCLGSMAEKAYQNSVGKIKGFFDKKVDKRDRFYTD
jgi:patatin-like phospholipase/acyl hydrolase